MAAMDVDQLIADAPPLHGDITHGLLAEALSLISGTVGSGDRTLETGSGYSTITFAMTGAEHTCVVPAPAEVAAIRSYCEREGISLERVTFEVEPSERVLPVRDLGPLDFVLIDGSHSFPQVFIDWFYVAGALKPGGTLVVDDIHVWTGRVLRDFLRAEPGWEPVTELRGRTAVFRKTAESDLDRVWDEQPLVRDRTRFGSISNKARQALSMVRHGQARTLLAELRRRGG
jgi:predicted O-methyltransferase YrrM